MFPRNENRNEGTFACSTGMKAVCMFPRNENWNKGTFAKTTLLRNRPLPVIKEYETSIRLWTSYDTNAVTQFLAGYIEQHCRHDTRQTQSIEHNTNPCCMCAITFEEMKVPCTGGAERGHIVEIVKQSTG